jgi:(R)-2-hydroxy-4-methylpentanoate CoA-transferase
MNIRPLEGIRILELSTFLAVPQCGRMLASLGADVIKIEALDGDFFRIEAPIFEVGIPYTEDENPIYLNANVGKRHIALNLKTHEGMQVFLKLIQKSDAFITNMRNMALEHLKIGFKDLHALNPALVYGHLSGYGEKGAEEARPGFDSQAYFARGGFLLDLSEPGCIPNEMVLGAGDSAAGVALTAGILGALVGANRNHEGHYVCVALLSTALWATTMHLVLAQHGLAFPRPRTNPYVAAITNVYRCKDGEWISITTSQDLMKDWSTLCQAIGLEHLLADERFNSLEKQMHHRQKLVGLLDRKFSEKTFTEWAEILGATHLTYEKVAHLMDVLDDPQARENKFFLKRSYSSGKQVYFATPPFKLQGQGEENLENTIHHGEHTREVLLELGYLPDEIKGLVTKKVIAS